MKYAILLGILGFAGWTSAQDEPRSLEATRVVASPLVISQGTLLKDLDSLDASDLHSRPSSSLAEMLKQEPGLSVRSMGPAPARPVYHGLSGEHVAVLENGLRTGDLSSTSPDHAVALEPDALHSLQIIQGPRLVRFSSSLVGVAVDGNSSLLTAELDSQWSVLQNVQGIYNQKGWSSHTQLDLPWNDYHVRLRGGYRQAGESLTPLGVVENTQIQNAHGEAQFLWTVGAWKHLMRGLLYQSNYGVPGGFVGAHPQGADIAMEKQDLDYVMQLTQDSSTHTAKLFHNYYHHREFEASGNTGAEFVSRLDGLRWEQKQDRWGNWIESEWGAEALVRRLEMGGFVFTPPTQQWEGNLWWAGTYSTTIKGLENTWGVRGGLVHFQPHANIYAPDSTFDSRTFPLFSVASSLQYRIAPGHFIQSEFFRTTRAPTLEELYNQGPHLASYTYEVGNQKLPSEVGYGFGTGYEFLRGDWRARVNAQATWFSDYLVTRATGDTNWAQLLPIYAQSSVPAWLGNIQGQWMYEPEHGWQIQIAVQSTVGHIPQQGSMPQIPPTQMRLATGYQSKHWSMHWNSEKALSQTRTDLFEEPTAGYLVHHLVLESPWKFSHWSWKGILMIQNITNTTYRNHLSRLKSIMPEEGRNISLRMVMDFK